MPDTTENTFDVAPPPTDPYLDHLDPDGQAVYRAASSGSDLSCEIRLLRTVLALLSSDRRKNHRDINSTINVLIRATQLQAKHHSTDSQLEQAVQKAAELVLESLDDAGPDIPKCDA